MNRVRVACNDEKLMKKADKRFAIVVHEPEEDSKEDFSGEFIIYDQMSQYKIRDILKGMYKDMKNTA